MSTDRDMTTALGLPDHDDLLGEVAWHDGWRTPPGCDKCHLPAAVKVLYYEITGPTPGAWSRTALENGPDNEDVEVTGRRRAWCLPHARKEIPKVLADDTTSLPHQLWVEVCGYAVLYQPTPQLGVAA